MTTRLILALAIVAACTIVPALIEGHYVHRWSSPPDLAGAANEVGGFPREFGAWSFKEEGEPLHPEVLRELAIAGYVSRSYENRNSGAIVRMLLMVGQSGPLLRHPPYVCYTNMAHEQMGDMTKIQATTTSPPSEFNLLEYKRAQAVTNDRFLVAYAMATDTTWKVPSIPRIEFGAAPMLYKVQLLIPLDPSQTREAGTTMLKQFADDFSAAFEKHLRAAKSRAGEKPAT